MAQGIRVTLPGYDCLTDTNLDHYSLYSDVDNVLIKRLLIGTATIADGSPTILTIPHNLGYIPYFIVYCDDANNGNWQILNNSYNIFSVPNEIASADTTNLYIYNFGGHVSGSLSVVYEIFYDNMNDTTAPSIIESSQVIKVSRPGKDALTSTNPNDYIMHSDLNTYKIIKEGNLTLDLNGLSTASIPHGATVTTPYKYLLFMKSSFDGKTVLLGGTGATKTYDQGTTILKTYMDGTNIYLTKNAAFFTEIFYFKYYILGSGVTNTAPTTGYEMAVTKPGSDVLTETNPDNFNFHSAFSTLKYFTSGTYSMTVSTTTVQTIAHNLGYVPCFIGFVNDLENIVSNGYALMPYYLGRSSIPLPNRDIAAFIYADATNIYLKSYYQTNAIGITKTFNFYYKIFHNNLGL